MAHDVFVSYSTKDKAVADTIVASMEKNSIRCWYAPRDIKPGEDWGTAITNAIDASQVFLMIFSGNANHSQRVLDELNYAVAHEVTIIPFRIENLEPKGAMMLHLSSRHWLDAYDPSWKSHIDNLIEMVSANIERQPEAEEVEEPEKPEELGEDEVEEGEEAQKKKKQVRFAAGAAVVLALIAAVWFGIPQLTQSSENIAQPTAINSEHEAAAPTQGEPAPTQTTEEPSSLLAPEDGDFIKNAVGEGCQIAYSSGRQGNTQISVLEAFSAVSRQLTDNRADNQHPTWSPEEQRIAFISVYPEEQSELSVMNQDGGNQVLLTLESAPEANRKPGWSPDGSQIVFESGEFFRTIAANGTQLDGEPVSENWWPGAYHDDSMPCWSPAGGRIAFVSDLYGDEDIFTVNVNGLDPVQVTKNDTRDLNPVYSPDGNRIAFITGENGADLTELAVINPDGSDPVQFGGYQMDEDTRPVWSPDSQMVAVESVEAGSKDIILVDLENGEEISRIDTGGNDTQPAWSPGGKLIAFVSDADGDEEIYIKEANGERLIQLTFNDVADLAPDWSPLCE